MPYKNRIRTLEESCRLVDSQINSLSKEGNSNPEKLAKLHESKLKYTSELKVLNRAQWEHDHDTVDFEDDR